VVCLPNEADCEVGAVVLLQRMRSVLGCSLNRRKHSVSKNRMIPVAAVATGKS
jgi:hypothetical protein